MANKVKGEEVGVCVVYRDIIVSSIQFVLFLLCLYICSIIEEIDHSFYCILDTIFFLFIYYGLTDYYKIQFDTCEKFHFHIIFFCSFISCS